jgi:hypothetical protein
VELITVKIFQAYGIESHKKWISKVVTPLSYENLPLGTEYDLFKHIASNNLGDDCWGLVSWKFNLKSPVKLDTFQEFCKTEFARGVDCVFINPMIANEAIFANPWEQGILSGHRGMKELYLDLVNKNFLTPLEVIGTNGLAFCNYFVANNFFWGRYFSFIDQILEYLEAQAKADTNVGIIYKGSAGYRKAIDMTMRPFIIERLFSSFIFQNSDLKVSGYQFIIEDYINKLGFVSGNFCKKLSDQKNLGLLNNNHSHLEAWHSKRIKLLKNSENLIVLFHLDDPSLNLVEM